MSTSNAFRSHLMQQFVAAARAQSRPPVALLASSTVRNGVAHSSSLRTDSLSSVKSIPVDDLSTSHSLYQSTTKSEYLEDYGSTMSFTPNPPHQTMDSSAMIQNAIKTRRTCSRFAPSLDRDVQFWKDALDRAVECALAAPNHKRTEPFRFVRMLGSAKEALALIAYHVRLQKNDDGAEAQAIRKQEKWSQVPAYLTVLVEQGANEGANDADDYALYETRPFHPPGSERALEDYAAACAAVQNILLSLHAESIATKWATGPVPETRAFRELVGAQPTERVVALVMVGEASDLRMKSRRLRRTWDDVMKDI